MAPPNSKRVKGISITRPIIYGNVAYPIDPVERPRGMPTDHTHSWSISVKGVDGADITHFIKKVQFKLHADTYANPTRTLEYPPFEVTESGWGEFEIQIKLFFHAESNEKPIMLFHYLKLHPYLGDEGEMEAARLDRRPVTSFVYEELVFNEPTEAMYDVLTSRGTARLPSKAKSKREEEFVAETEALELDRLGEGLRIVNQHVQEIREKLTEREREMVEMRKRLES
ncbi:yeats family-domain-containing protein [Trichophaea hybrida]|nr:yeats family-domain-containing protein [Trichophaea hybrida]